MMIYSGDNMEFLATLPDNFADSIVTDPPYGLSFMGKKWDYDVPDVALWAECLRVLKPGGHLLAFAGTRTQHRMAVRIEDAGFEIRDMMAWVYGSGFPKSLDISKAIDKAAGAEREVISAVTAPVGDGTVYGVGHSGALTSNDPVTEAAAQWHGWGTALKPALEPITLARKPLTGTVAANVLQHGAGGLNIDGCRVGDETLPAATRGLSQLGTFEGADGNITPGRTGRWPANLMHDGGDYFGEQSRFFYCAKASKADRNYGCDLLPHVSAADMVDREPDSDGMSSPRAGAGRTAGAKNNHPTVKPIELMRYLCRLVTPPGGIVLDPFTGSGSTAVGAALEGFIFFGAELDAGYHKIATARLDKALQDGYIDTKSNKGD